VAATSVAALRAATAHVAARRIEHAAQITRADEAQRRFTEGESAVRAQEAALREAELARRAIARRLTERAAAERLHTERRLEDEADDVYRARSHEIRARAGRSTVR